MPITYYPGETNKKLMHVIEQQQQPNTLQSVYGVYDMNDGALTAGLWCAKGWEIKRISIHFLNSLAKDYAISIVRGIGIVSGKNDRLWVKVDTLAAQEIIIPQGFYTASTISTALAAALNAKDFPASFKPFAVSYTSGLFSITPAAGNAKVFTTNTTTQVRRISTMAPLIGFTTNSSMTTPVTSDQTQLGLDGLAMVLLSGSASTSVDVMSTDTLAMTIDNRLQITASYAPAGLLDLVMYEIVYKVLDV
jgi:hypothetical protein